jgi:hypothetical protein
LLLRINDKAAHRERWQAGALAPGSHDFILGEALGYLARTGDIPRRVSAKGHGRRSGGSIASWTARARPRRGSG